MAELAEAQKRTEQRLDTVERRLDRVEQRLDHVEQRLDEVEQRLEKLEQRVDKMDKRLHRVEVRLGRVEGKLAEYVFRDKAPAYLGTHGFRRTRSLSPSEWVQIVDAAEEDGHITPEERGQALLVDAVVQGRYQGRDVLLVAEISVTIEDKDVARVAERASIWQKALPDYRVIPVVAGEHIAPTAWERAKTEKVVVLLDGDIYTSAVEA